MPGIPVTSRQLVRAHGLRKQQRAEGEMTLAESGPMTHHDVRIARAKRDGPPSKGRADHRVRSLRRLYFFAAERSVKTIFVNRSGFM